MAQVDFTPSPVFRPTAPKAKMTIYFALLIVALVALVIGCVFLFLEIRRFGGFGTVQGRVAAVETGVPAGLVVAHHAAANSTASPGATR